jgi:GTPase SAR1 family protein
MKRNIGMAGSGKTTLAARLGTYLSQAGRAASSSSNNSSSSAPAVPGGRPRPNPYMVNLDPAVRSTPYEPAIDIRDTVHYKNVMAEYKLGPNGGILTCLNLFATRFDQVVTLLERRRGGGGGGGGEGAAGGGEASPSDAPISHAIIDTPGQIEIFAWSASGSIMTDALAASLPTCVLFVMDSPRCASPPTALVANLLQAASILYRTRLPLLLAFNKADVGGADAVASWVGDWEKLDDALSREKAYAASLARSLSLVLDEFTNALPHVCVSAATGQGMDELVEKLEECRERYHEEYRPGVEAARRARDEAREGAEAERQAAELGKLSLDGGIGDEGVSGLERAVRAVNGGGGGEEEGGSGGA